MSEEENAMSHKILTQQVEMREGAHVDLLKEFCSHISESFFEPDIQAARIILGTAFAHYFPRVAPIWMFVVGPPSSGKTAITIEALSGLTGMFGKGQAWGKQVDLSRGNDDNVNPHYKDNEAVEIMSTINNNSFLSHQIGVADPGLLEQISGGKFYMEKNDTRKIVAGNMLCLIPDFTVMASMNKEKRGEIMGQLRRIFDGRFEKKVGTRVTKIWQGKMSILAATTPVIDKYTSIDSALGERFIQINWRASKDEGRGKFTLQQMRRNAKGFNVKRPMKDMVRKLFANATAELLDLPDDNLVDDRLSALAELTADGRASVYGYLDEKTYRVKEIAGAEDIHRIIQEFYAQLSGISRLQDRSFPNEQDIQDVLRVGIETLPTYRSVVLQAAIEGKKLSDYAGRDRDKRIEATKLCALGIIERADIGDAPVKLRKKWESVVDRCGFDFSTVFENDGAAAGRERAEQARQTEMAAGLDDEKF